MVDGKAYDPTKAYKDSKVPIIFSAGGKIWTCFDGSRDSGRRAMY